MIDSRRDGTTLATGLGWFSIGLGTAELLAPSMLAKVIGASDTAGARKTLRLFGVRELVAGAMILSGPRRSLPLWTRVVGDAIDLSALVLAMRHRKADRARLLGSIASAMGVTALDVVAAVMNSRRASSARKPVIETITVNRPPSEVYAMWRDFERFPRFMNWLESVRDLGNGLTQWTARLPIGGTITWTAVTTEDRPSQRIAWRTVEKAKVPNRGTVVFKPTLNGMGTEIEVQMQYDVPGSKRLGALFAKLASKEQINGDLKRFKQVLETGEVVRSDASIHRGPHAARPPMPSEKSLEKGVQL